MRDPRSVLVVGGAGYIGSRFFCDLSKKYKIESWDICRFTDPVCKNTKKDYAEITKDDLKEFQNVIVLAGHSSVRMCDGKSSGVMKNNVTNLVRLCDLLEEDGLTSLSYSILNTNNISENVRHIKVEL